MGRHHVEDRGLVDVEGIRVDSFVEKGSGVNKGEAGSHPRRRKIKRMMLYRMVFELRQVVLVLREELVGHLANFREREDR